MAAHGSYSIAALGLLSFLAHGRVGGASEPLRCGVLKAHQCISDAVGNKKARTTYESEYADFVQRRIDTCFAPTIKEATKSGGKCFYNKEKVSITGPIDSRCELCPRIAEFIEQDYIAGTGVKWPCYNHKLAEVLFQENAQCLGVSFSKYDLYKLSAVEATHLADGKQRRRGGVTFVSALGRIDFCRGNDAARADSTAKCFHKLGGGTAAMPAYCAKVTECVAESDSKCDREAGLKQMCKCLEKVGESRFDTFKHNIDRTLYGVNRGKITTQQCEVDILDAFTSQGTSYWTASQYVVENCMKSEPFFDMDDMAAAACNAAVDKRHVVVARMLYIYVNLMNFLVERFTRYCACL